MRGKQESLPEQDALLKCMEVGKGTAEGAKYLCVQFDKRVFAMKLGDAAKPLQEQMHAFAKYVAFQLDPNKDIWPGRASAITTAFEKLQVNLATEGVKALENVKENEYTMYLALSDEGEVLRAYTADKRELPVTEYHAEGEHKPGNEVAVGSGGG